VRNGSGPAPFPPDLNVAIKGNTHSPAEKGPFSLRNTLVVTEVALALVLLTGAALMAQSIVRQLRVDTGFRTDHILTAKLQLNQTSYSRDEAQISFARKLLLALRAQPGLSGVGMSSVSVMEGSSLMSFDPGTLGLKEKSTNLEIRSVTPGFLETMGIRLLAGRLFTDSDAIGAPKTVVINEAMARHFFAGTTPVGRILNWGRKPGTNTK